jgi:hypothetical protein
MQEAVDVAAAAAAIISSRDAVSEVAVRHEHLKVLVVCTVRSP